MELTKQIILLRDLFLTHSFHHRCITAHLRVPPPAESPFNPRLYLLCLQTVGHLNIQHKVNLNLKLYLCPVLLLKFLFDIHWITAANTSGLCMSTLKYS